MYSMAAAVKIVSFRARIHFYNKYNILYKNIYYIMLIRLAIVIIFYNI